MIDQVDKPMKLRMINAPWEADGSPEELARFIRDLDLPVSAVKQTEMATPDKESTEITVPKAAKLAETIKQRGQPISFTMAEIQIEQHGRKIRRDERIYQSYYQAFNEAKQLLAKELGGSWHTSDEKIGNRRTKRYTLKQDET